MPYAENGMRQRVLDACQTFAQLTPEDWEGFACLFEGYARLQAERAEVEEVLAIAGRRPDGRSQAACQLALLDRPVILVDAARLVPILGIARA